MGGKRCVEISAVNLYVEQHHFDWQQCSSRLAFCLAGTICLNSAPGWANDNLELGQTEGTHRTAQIVQGNPSLVQITDVRFEENDAGLQIILETSDGPLVTSETTTSGNALLLEISNAQLTLPNGDRLIEFEADEDIALVQVSSLTDSRVQVVITGNDAVPEVAINSDAAALTLNVVPGTVQATADEAPLRILVAAEDEGYSPSSARTATRTDTPLRDIPQSIQVIPQQVIEDQGIVRLGDALRNVSGVAVQRDRTNASDRFVVRGFENSRLLRNGFRTGSNFGGTIATARNTVERIEVLKGPASVLYGQVEPGGVINFVTKQPSQESFYDLSLGVGSFGYIEPKLDFSGPLTTDGKLTYRLNASYQNDGRFRDFVDLDIVSVSPVLRYDFSDATSLTFEYSFIDLEQTYDDGVFIDPLTFDLPRELFLGEPSDTYESTTNSFLLTLDHRFSDSISLRSGFVAELSDIEEIAFRPFSLDSETGEVDRQFVDRDFSPENYSWQTDLVSNFKTGLIEHQLLAGFELSWTDVPETRADLFDPGALTINVFNPEYNTPIPSFEERNSFGPFETNERTVGLYLQDQITLLPNLKLLAGGRLDFARFEQDFEISFDNLLFSDSTEFDTEAFSPRLGIVYQPIDPVSLYTSFSRSFIPNSVTTVNGDVIEPERGTQFEIGARAELGDIIVNLAAYNITKTNITQTDPDNPDFSIPIGEVTSRGIELDVAGEITSGWNVISSLFFNDAFVSEGDSNSPEGDNLRNAPRSGASLWTTYEIQSGDFEGLGFGAGLFYQGDREAQLPNDFVLLSYVRADASVFYKRDNWKAQLNFQNLFDENFLESAQSTLLAFPGAPFTVIGSFSIRF